MSHHVRGAASPFPPGVRTVGVFSPAGIASEAALARGVARLRSWGVEVVHPAIAGSRERYLAGTDDARLDQLHELLRNPQVEALLAARGGYGCARLLDGMDWDLLLERQLPIVGYSDVTALLVGALRRGYTRGIAGPMVASDFGRELRPAGDAWAFARMLDSFTQAWEQASVAAWATRDAAVLQSGSAHGTLVPATLSVLVTLIGTSHMPDLSGAILVLEDIYEPAYKLDRYLTHLRQSGILSALAGLVFGDFRDVDGAEHLPALFAEFATSVAGPVVAAFAFGHRFPSVSLPVGRTCELVAGEGAVELRWAAPEYGRRNGAHRAYPEGVSIPVAG